MKRVKLDTPTSPCQDQKTGDRSIVTCQIPWVSAQADQWDHLAGNYFESQWLWTGKGLIHAVWAAVLWYWPERWQMPLWWVRWDCGQGGLKHPLEDETKVVPGYKRDKDPESCLQLHIKRDTLHCSVSQPTQTASNCYSLFLHQNLPTGLSLLQKNSHSGESLLQGF